MSSNTLYPNKSSPQPMVKKNSALEDTQQRAIELIETQKRLGLKLTVTDRNVNNISGKFENVADVLQNMDFIGNLTQVLFISNTAEDTWFKISVDKGKIKQTEFLAMFKINWVKIINKKYNQFDFFVVGYTPGSEQVGAATTAVPACDYTPERILKHFPQLIEQTTNSKDIGKLICHILSKYLISPNHTNLIYIGMKQGFSKDLSGKIKFSPIHLLPNEIEQYLSKGLLARQYPTAFDISAKEDMTAILSPLLNGQKELQLVVLVRIASWYQSFFAKTDIYVENIIMVKPAADFPVRTLIALLNNLRYDSLDVPAIGPNINSLKFDIENVGDGMVTAIDVFSADQVKKAEKGYDLLINDIHSRINNENSLHHISVLISNYADLYIPAELVCVLELSGVVPEYSANTYKSALRRLDEKLIELTERNCNNGEFIKEFNAYVAEIQKNIPDAVPQSKRNMYIMLVTAYNLYNEFFSPLFASDIEKYIEEWLASQENNHQSLDEVICSEYAKILNQRISSGYYRIIQKEEVTPFDKGEHILVVNRKARCIYLETAESIDIAKNEMESVNNSDSLTAALYSCEYIPHNSKSEKSVRIAAVDSEGIPYPLYVHAISYTLLTLKNRQLFELIDKQANLFTCEELPKKDFLPLIKTSDGRFAGKMLIYENEESNIYFGTGKTGSGKSWAIAQIVAMLAELKYKVVVFDVSGSYTEQKLLRMLPADVVEKLFKFYNVGKGKDRIPVDLGSLKGCTNLPDKKRAIYSVLRAATGRIDKNVDRKLKGFLSEYLKDKKESVDLKELRSQLEEKGSFGSEIADSIHSVVNDIDAIQFENHNWDELLVSGQVIVINLGNEVGDGIHQLLDMMIGSLFNWQMVNDTGFLFITIDELIDQDFSKGSPLNTIVKQGRKFHTALIGATQDYFNQGSSNLDTMKQANIKSFCRPGKSEDRVAQKLGYSGAVDAGFNKFKAGDTIIEFDGYNKETGENEALIMKGRVVNFVETPFYETFKQEYEGQ